MFHLREGDWEQVGKLFGTVTSRIFRGRCSRRFGTQEVLLSTDASGARGSDRKTLELRASGEVSYKGRVFKSGKTRILFAFNHLDSFCIDDWRFLIKIDLPPETGTLYSRCRSHRAFDMFLCQLDSISLPFERASRS